MIGEIIDKRYEIITLLGSGGNSFVYLAKDLKLNKYWAVKNTIEFSEKELNFLISLNHSDIPRVVDRVINDQGLFIVMDYLNGISLKNKVLSQGMQKEDDVINWGIQLCDIFNYLHNNKKCPVIYRDIKPENIILTEDGKIKLIDFGNAVEYIRGERTLETFVGTKGYAAPEQYLDGTNILSPETDIYGLGATLSYLLAKKVTASIRAINPLVSKELERILGKCIEKDPENRYENMNSLKVDLQKLSFLLS